MKGPFMILTSQFWDFISVFVYALVILLGIFAFIVDMLVLWTIWELFWHWFRKKKKGYDYE